MKGKVGYAPPPVGPTGRRESNMWTWSLVMNAHSRHKQEAWRFMERAAGREFLRRAAFEGNMNPTRRSTWDDPEFRNTAAAWGDFYPVTRKLIEHDARVLVTPHARYPTSTPSLPLRRAEHAAARAHWCTNELHRDGAMPAFFLKRREK